MTENKTPLIDTAREPNAEKESARMGAEAAVCGEKQDGQGQHAQPMAEVGVRLESAGVERLLQRLSAALEGRERLVDAFLKSVGGSPEFFRVDLERLPAAGAVQLRAVFEPTDLLRDLFRAVGAGDIDRLIVENSGHGGLRAK